MEISITLERTKQSLLEFPKETICAWSATDFEIETAKILGRYYEVDYEPNPDDQRFPDIELPDENIGIECKKSKRSWRIQGNSRNQVEKALARLTEIWIIFLNQKICEIKYAPHHICAIRVVPDIRYRHLVDMQVR